MPIHYLTIIILQPLIPRKTTARLVGNSVLVNDTCIIRRNKVDRAPKSRAHGTRVYNQRKTKHGTKRKSTPSSLFYYDINSARFLPFNRLSHLHTYPICMYTHLKNIILIHRETFKMQIPPLTGHLEYVNKQALAYKRELI